MGRQLLQGVICCGGGPISMFELKELMRLGFPALYLPTEVRIRVADSNLTSGLSDVNRYGIINRWVTHTGFPTKCWVVMDQNTPQKLGSLAAGGAETNTGDKNMVTWVDEVVQQHVYPKFNPSNHMKWRTPTKPVPNEFGTPRVVLRRDYLQREIEIGFKIKQVRSVACVLSSSGP